MADLMSNLPARRVPTYFRFYSRALDGFESEYELQKMIDRIAEVVIKDKIAMFPYGMPEELANCSDFLNSVYKVIAEQLRMMGMCPRAFLTMQVVRHQPRLATVLGTFT